MTTVITNHGFRGFMPLFIALKVWGAVTSLGGRHYGMVCVFRNQVKCTPRHHKMASSHQIWIGLEVSNR